MKAALIAVVLSVVTTLAGMAAAPAIRTTLRTHDETWVGQQVGLEIELVAPGYFAGAAMFDLPRIPGVLIFPPIGSPTLGTETIDGAECTVQHHELIVFSQKPGEIEIPPFEIRFSTKASALDKASVPQSLKNQPVKFTAKQPPGSHPSEWIITSADLTLKETWKPEPKDGKPGDAFARTLTWDASDVPGMAFPPLASDTITGIGIYQGEPSVTDHSECGTLHGQRLDTVTYVCKSGGQFTIPARIVRWWDSAAKEMKSQELPTRTFQIIAPPPPPVPLSDRLIGYYRLNRKAIFMILIGGVAAVVVFLKTRPFWFRLYRQCFPCHLSPLNPP